MVHSGRFTEHKSHHSGWFKVFRFGSAIEIWLGPRWILFDLGES